VQTIYATIQALKEYFEEGESAKFARHRAVYEAIHDGLEKLGLETIIDRKIESGLVVSVKYPDDPNWDFEKVHDYSFGHFADKECGEWYGYLHKDGTVSHTQKGSMWKGPFHYPRMLMNMEMLFEHLEKGEQVVSLL
jgi:hypothetical protein